MDIRARAPRGQLFEPVTLEAIESYARLMRIDLEPFEAEMLFQIDNEWQKAQPTPETSTAPPTGRPQHPRRP